MSEQTSWKWCRKCQGLFYLQSPSAAAASTPASDDDDGFEVTCPAGDDHDAAKSGDYTLFVDNSPWGVAETGWKYCHKCNGLYLATAGNAGTCPMDNGAHDSTGSGAYVLPTSAPAASLNAGNQGDWKACGKCRGLFHTGATDDVNVCPTGETHTGGNSTYFLKYEPQHVIRSVAFRWRTPADVTAAAHPEDAAYLYLTQRTDLQNSPVQADGGARGGPQMFKLVPTSPPSATDFYLQAADNAYLKVADGGSLITKTAPAIAATATDAERTAADLAWRDTFELCAATNAGIPGTVVSIKAKRGWGNGKYFTIPTNFGGDANNPNRHNVVLCVADAVGGPSEQFERVDVANLAGDGLRDAITATEWYAIQAFVETAKRLPVADDAFRNALHLDDDDAHYFDKMKTAFQHINTHAQNWRTAAGDGVYDDVVRHSSSIFHYAQRAIGYDPAHPTPADLNGPAKGYYGALSDALDVMLTTPTAKNRAKFDAILAGLQADAVTYAKEAADLAKRISDFSIQLGDDKTELDAAHTYLNNEYNWVDQDLSTIEADLAAANNALAEDTADYNHDVVIAATTVTYCWYPVLGNISAIVVAGIYGKRATEKLKDIDRDKARIDTDNKQIIRDLAILAAMKTGGNLMDHLGDQLGAALAIVQRLQGIWNAMASDLADLRDRILPTDIKKAKAMVKDLGIAEAIAVWRSVGKRADQFRVNAYVTVTEQAAA